MATTLPADDSLKKLQQYVQQANKERGFHTETASEKLVLLTEELGELAKAVRKVAGIKFTQTTQQKAVADEVADVLIVLLDLSSLLRVDAYEAFLAKEAHNRERVWK